VVDWAGTTLAAESVEAADPGLCVAALSRIGSPERLIDYGRGAKERIFTKEDAYGLARALGVHLSEHGGTGLGVIGALAGAGLRLSGNDGRFKGKFRIPGDGDGVALVSQIKTHGVDDVRTTTGDSVADQERVIVGDECKLVLLDHGAVLLVEAAGDGAQARWRVMHRKALRGY